MTELSPPVLLVPPGSSISSSSSNISGWIGKGKIYEDIPSFISKELLQRLEIPHNARDLLPSDTQPISVLITMEFPPVRTLTLVHPSSCFSDREPNTTVDTLWERPVPSREFINKLRSLAGQAMLDGKTSIRDWMQKENQIYLPFSALKFWSMLLDCISTKLSWTRAMTWFRDQRLPSNLIARIETTITQIPWNGSIRSLGGFVNVTDMALFLSDQMLSESHVDAMLALLRLRVSDSHSEKDSVIIEQTAFGQALTGIPQYKSAYPQGAADILIKSAARLKAAKVPTQMISVAHSHPVHFGALLIKKSILGFEVCWLDSMKRPQPAKMVKGLKTWFAYHFKGDRLSFTENTQCAKQADAYSCSVIGINTLKNQLFNDPLWTVKTREIHRVTEFLDIMEYHAKHLVCQIYINTISFF